MNLENHNLISQLIEDESFIRWIKGSNKNDTDYWNRWISNNPDKIEAIETAKATLNGIAFNKKTIDHEKITDQLNDVLDKVRANSKKEQNQFSRVLKSNLGKYAIAAVVVIFAFIGTSIYLNDESIITHKTAYGEILDLKLPDGTSVVLNGNSEITYPKENPRLLSLEGEAYFKVKPIPSTNAKFWVNTNDLQVEVFGTMFHVNTRKKNTKVALDEGSIHLKLKNGESKKMIPGDLVSFSKEKNQISYKSVSKTSTYSLWRNGTYTFNNITLKEVMKNLEFSYGVKAIFKNKALENLKLTGGIPNKNMGICIAAIEKVTGTRIIQKDDELIINEH